MVLHPNMAALALMFDVAAEVAGMDITHSVVDVHLIAD